MKISLITLTLVLSMSFVSAQNNTKVPEVRLGKIKSSETDGKKIVSSTITTQKEILANPKLVVTEPGYEMTGFIFSIFSLNDDKKKDEYIGPFKTKGNELTGKMLLLIEKYPAANIYIDSISYKYNGEDGKFAKSIFFSYKNL